MRILFVGHTFHTRSRSSAFFLNTLARTFEVASAYVDPETLDLAALPDADFDLVVLWQMDFLAPWFIAGGYRTAVVPMYDASAGLPDSHFAMMREALFVNFSAALHTRIARLGCRSLFARYFPDPGGHPQTDDFSTLRGFFWRRRPAEIDIELIDRMLGDTLARLHVHDAPDYEGAPELPATRVGFGECVVTTSRWFADADDYLAILRQCNVYVAPRLAEGIGMGFLEAMARGMVVVANDSPTHHEYIAHGYNGLLFEPGRAGPLDLLGAATVGEAARRTVERGRRHWLVQERALVNAIEEFAGPRRPASRALRDFAAEAIAAYRRSVDDYGSFLSAAERGIELTALRRLDEVRRLFAAQPEAAGEGAAGEEGGERVGGLLAGAIHVTFGQGNASAFTTAGWSTPEGSHTWIEGHCGVLCLPLGPGLAGERVRLSLDAFTVEPLKDAQEVEIVVAGIPSGRVRVPFTFEDGGVVHTTSEAPIDPADTFTVEFRATETWREPDGGRELSLALRALSIIRA